MASLPTGTVAFLFADIEGSTRLLRQLGDRYADVLAAHHHLLRSALEETHGQVVDTQGDAVFAVFARARDAVLAAYRDLNPGTAGSTTRQAISPARIHSVSTSAPSKRPSPSRRTGSHASSESVPM